MWPDNETEIDLLGFDFLVDSLVIVLSEPRLLPLTAGVLGDWGSGKSSLMRLACTELNAIGGPETPRYVCVQFSPWRYEDYEDVKVSLMSTILTRLAAEIPERKEDVGRLKAFGRRLRRPGRRLARGGIGLTPAAVPFVAGLIDPTLDPELLKVAQQAVQAGAGAAAQRLADPAAPPTGNDDPITEVDEFRDRFADLIRSLDKVAAVVVFIDDLDRCLPETVVDTFEAIRLLLGAPRTAFVLAAHQKVVESAVDARYPELRGDGRTGGIGAQYLEKMFQQRITVPSLAIPEAVTYINLLLAELHLPDEDFTRVRSHVAAQRATHTLQVVFNLGTLGELDVTVPAGLVVDLQWATAIGPILAAGSRGNPRQIKQFLNTLQLRRRSADRRGVSLDPAVLAKLMLLEQQHFDDFQQVFDWLIESGGASCLQLDAAEQDLMAAAAEPPDPEANQATDASGDARKPHSPSRARSTPRRPARPQLDTAVREWAAKPTVAAWLALPPTLGSLDLRPYFTYSRDRLSLSAVSVTRLPGRLQQLVARMLGPTDRLRHAALDDVIAAGPADQDLIVEALARELLTRPDDAFVAVCETVDRLERSRNVLFGTLGRLPIAAVPVQYVATAAARLPGNDRRTGALLDRWAAGNRADLTRMVSIARRPRARR